MYVASILRTVVYYVLAYIHVGKITLAMVKFIYSSTFKNVIFESVKIKMFSNMSR